MIRHHEFLRKEWMIKKRWTFNCETFHCKEIQRKSHLLQPVIRGVPAISLTIPLKTLIKLIKVLPIKTLRISKYCWIHILYERDARCCSKSSTMTDNAQSVPEEEYFNAPTSSPVVLRKHKPSITNRAINFPTSTGDNLSDDCSDQSEEDVGVYSESFRKSHWVQLSDSRPLPQPSTVDRVNDDDIFVSRDEDGADAKSGDASRYNRVRKCLVQRKQSQQEFYRYSQRFYDLGATFVLERDDILDDFGLHVYGSHPAFVSAVDVESSAERSGVVAGQVVISVNGQNVLQASHDDIINLIRLSTTQLCLQLVSVSGVPSRDLQAPIHTGYLSKLSGSPTVMRRWRRRWFVLRQDNCLYYYKTDGDLDPLGAIPLLHYRLAKALDINKPYVFKLEYFGAKTYYLMATNEVDMSSWTGVISDAAKTPAKTETWMDVTTHNIGLPAVSIARPDCRGYLAKMGHQLRVWRRRYCVLRDACLYYYKNIDSVSAQGMAHLHGYKVDNSQQTSKRFTISLLPPDDNMRRFYFAADNETDMLRWTDAFKTSIYRWVCVDP